MPPGVTIHTTESPSVSQRTRSRPLQNASKKYSCVTCHTRKVKCDRDQPCTSCLKTGSECTYTEPPPPRRRMKKPKQSSAARLKRYQEVLRNHGIDPDIDFSQNTPSSDGGNKTCSRNSQPPRLCMSASSESRQSKELEAKSGKLITKCGKSMYIENPLWASISLQLRDSTEILNESSDDDGDNQCTRDGAEKHFSPEASLLFNFSSKRSSIANLHPSPIHIMKLWQVFLDNVNPLTKIVHTQSVQQRILKACDNLGAVEQGFEALMFGIYCVSLTSLNSKDVERLFGTTKLLFLTSCQQGAQQALNNAGVLKSTELTVLQALILYIIHISSFCDPLAVWTLGGITVRMAQRLGLHRDGLSLGLSVFETEMRRRIWWQILTVDVHNARRAGSASNTIAISSMDTRLPLNINDIDLNPDMKETPLEHTGLTEMAFCLMKYEVGRFLCQNAGLPSNSYGVWSVLTSPFVEMTEKDRILNELENLLEGKFLKYSDESIPLHLLTLVVAKGALCTMALMMHQSHQGQERVAFISRRDNGRFFSRFLELAEYANMIHLTHATEGFLWHTRQHVPWHALIYLLSELQHRTAGSEVERAWRLMDSYYYRSYREIIPKTKNAFHLAIGNLAIKAWAAYETHSVDLNQYSISRPKLITALHRKLQGSPAPAQPGVKSRSYDNLSSTGYCEGPQLQDITFPDSSTPINYNASPSEYLPIDWGQWNDLLKQFQHSEDME